MPLELAERVWTLRVHEHAKNVNVVCALIADDRSSLSLSECSDWAHLGQSLFARSLSILNREPPRPEIDHPRCVRIAQEYQAYFARLLKDSAVETAHWVEMKLIAEEWLAMLLNGHPEEVRLTAFTERVSTAARGNAHGGIGWFGLSTSIDVWLRSLGRLGIADDLWTETVDDVFGLTA